MITLEKHALPLLSLFAMSLLTLPSLAEASAQQGEYHKAKAVYNSKDYVVTYMIDGGSLERISTQDGLSLFISDDNVAGGTLELVLPAQLVRSTIPGAEPYARSITSSFPSQWEATELSAPTCDTLVLKMEFYNGGEKTISAVHLLGNSQPLRGEYVTPTLVLPEGNFTLESMMTADKCDFSLDKEQKKLHVRVESSVSDRQEFIQLTIPHALLDGNYSVLIDGQETGDFSTSSGANSTTITLGYSGATHSIDFVGTTVIPEFSYGTVVLSTVLAAGLFGAKLFGTLTLRRK